MRLTVAYEWDIETVDENGDITEHDFADKLTDLGTLDGGELVLVRTEGSDADGVTDRQWAYVKDGQLPEYFKDADGREGAAVPRRFHDEFRRLLAGRH